MFVTALAIQSFQTVWNQCNTSFAENNMITAYHSELPYRGLVSPKFF